MASYLTLKITGLARDLFADSSGSHDWEHTLRVVKLCERIGPAENACMETLRIAALLHDIGRCHQDRSRGAVCHAEKGAEMAGEILNGLDVAEHQKNNIIHCIASHRFRGDKPPESTEAKVLFDADKIDSIGAIGVARAYLFAGEIGACLHNDRIDIEKTLPYSVNDTGYREYKVKLSGVISRILTGEGKKIASKRHEFMKMYFDRFLREYEGKD